MRLLASAERWHPQRDAWSRCADLPRARFGLTLSPGRSGEVLAVGGQSHEGLCGASRWSPETDRWQPAAPMAAPRYLHAQVRLGPHTYFLGGIGEAPPGQPQPSLKSVERFSADGGFETRAPLPHARVESAAVALGPVRLLLSGGYDEEGSLRSCFLYDAAADRWRATGPLCEARAGHAMIRLADGWVLALGGVDDRFEQPVSCAELWDPATERWSRIDGPRQPRLGASCSPLPDGRLLLAGGRHQGVALDSAELWTPP